MADVEISEQRKAQNLKRDRDVTELYLSKIGLNSLKDLTQYRNLQILWLNGNKLRHIEGLDKNIRLKELYLHNNELISVKGALERLVCLEVLFLHNNQLEKLQQVVHELRNMKFLKTLSLFHNPVAQETGYRLYTIYHIPSLELLDRKEVLKIEVDTAHRTHNKERDIVNQRIAFLRRAQNPAPDNFTALLTIPANFEVGNNFYRSNPPFENLEEAVNARNLRRSIMEYTALDWANVPRSCQVRRQTDQPIKRPVTITTQFR